MNKRDLKRLRIDPSYIISPERFMTMFGIESDKVKKLTIHDLHYILGSSLNHVGVNKINPDKIYNGEIILIGTVKYFKPYYRPIIYRIKVNDKIEEEIKLKENDISSANLSKLCDLYEKADDNEELDRYLEEIYERSNIDIEDELQPARTKIYAFNNKTRKHWY